MKGFVENKFNGIIIYFPKTICLRVFNSMLWILNQFYVDVYFAEALIHFKKYWNYSLIQIRNLVYVTVLNSFFFLQLTIDNPRITYSFVALAKEKKK